MIARITVDLQAIERNAQALAALIAPSRAAFVVKANAYGHGIARVAQTVAPYSARLCVYSLEEACALRDAGIKGDVFVMGPVDGRDLPEAFARDVEVALWDTGSYLQSLIRAAENAQTRARVHAKIDTGVTRLGLNLAHAPHAMETYVKERAISVEGVFSHLAAAEELDSPFTATQLDRFERAYEAMMPAFHRAKIEPQRHIAASAAAMLWPQTRLDFARIGIALYGLWPSPQTRIAMNGQAMELTPALSFATQLVAVRDVEAGTSVGYGATYHTPRATRIGVIPVGYADGIPRAFSNTGSFIVGGVRCPIAGRVCMNMTMLDVGAVPNAEPGAPVTLIGRDGDAEVSADEWAAWADTINYEIVARLPGHLPRLYR